MFVVRHRRQTLNRTNVVCSFGEVVMVLDTTDGVVEEYSLDELIISGFTFKDLIGCKGSPSAGRALISPTGFDNLLNGRLRVEVPFDSQCDIFLHNKFYMGFHLWLTGNTRCITIKDVNRELICTIEVMKRFHYLETKLIWARKLYKDIYRVLFRLVCYENASARTTLAHVLLYMIWDGDNKLVIDKIEGSKDVGEVCYFDEDYRIEPTLAAKVALREV